MRRRCVFILPPCVSKDYYNKNEGQVFYNKLRKEVPLGALTLATYIREKCNVERVEIIDFNLEIADLYAQGEVNSETDAINYIIKKIKDLDGKEYDFCGISAIFNQTYGWLELISHEFKTKFPDILVIAGGGVPTNLPGDVFEKCPCIDYVSYGEGEVGLRGLIDAENEEKFIENSKSIISRKKLQNHEWRPQFELIEDLDEIPPLDFNLVQLSKYDHPTHPMKDIKVVAIPLMFSRGCPFNCCFCASHSVHGKKVRWNSMKRIESDIRRLVEEYGMNTVAIWDDNFFVDKEKAKNLLQLFSQLNLVVEFSNSLPVYQIDDEIASLLKEAGVDVVTLAIESGNERVLRDIIHKPLKLEMVPKAIDILRKYDFYIHGLFVIGFPGETLEDIEITMNFIHQSKINWAHIFVASPLPGSELMSRCLEGGYLDIKDVADIAFMKGSISTEEWTAQDIEDIQRYNTIKKDFINNLDMQEGNYSGALKNFGFVIDAHYENPFAYFYAAKCLEKLGNREKATEYYDSCKKIIHTNIGYRELWNRFIDEGVSLSPVVE